MSENRISSLSPPDEIKVLKRGTTGVLERSGEYEGRKPCALIIDERMWMLGRGGERIYVILAVAHLIVSARP